MKRVIVASAVLLLLGASAVIAQTPSPKNDKIDEAIAILQEAKLIPDTTVTQTTTVTETTTQTVTETTSPSPTPPPGPQTGFVGIGTNFETSINEPASLDAFEAAVGRDVGVFRLYEDIEADTLTAADRANAIDAGAIAIQIDVPTSSTWAALANGQWDSRLRVWATTLKDLAAQGVKLFVIPVAHEPETGLPTNRGSATDFVNAVRHQVDLFRAEGVPAKYVFAPILSNFSTKMQAPAGGGWYPGDAYIDVLAPDGYNWNGPDSCDASKTFSGMFQVVVDQARIHGKLWGVSEFGSTHRPASPLHQRDWLNAAGAFVDANRSDMAYISYWYNNARCDWTFYRQEAFEAFRGLIE